MHTVRAKNRRRATILLMVVSLLALLFVIVTGFLSLARNNRAMVNDVSHNELIDAVADDMDEWAISLIKQQIIDASGQVLAGSGPETFASEDIAGYRQSNYLAALEPIWDPEPFVPTALRNGSWNVLGELCWPAVTSLDGAVDRPQAFPLFRLMRDYNYSQPGFLMVDAQWNARKPFMDADGDGVPDSHFLLCAPATEAANTMAGTSVRLPRFDPSDPLGANGAFVPFRIRQPIQDIGGDSSYGSHVWQRYDKHARFDVATRIVSHGGMVTLSAPTLYDANNNPSVPFNREFTIRMFDRIRGGGLPGGGSRPMREQYSNFDEQNRLFDELQASVAGVEASLRRRFTLPSPPDDSYQADVYRRIPPILSELQGETDRHLGFFSTFVPSFNYPSPRTDLGNWQRINIGVEARFGDERSAWAQVVALNATLFNAAASGGGNWGMPPVDYNPRHLITTINNSDELARKQEPGDPLPTDALKLDLGVPGTRGATFAGELKFYLGEVAKAFIEVDALGSKSLTPTGRYSYDPEKGNLIIQRLAAIYYDLLRGYTDPTGSNDDWGSLTGSAGSAKEAVNRRQQAFMLAVNTVAAATPRNNGAAGPRGFIPVVSYADVHTMVDPLLTMDHPWSNGVGATELRFNGYAPQPFFTEAIAYQTQYDSNDPDDEADVENIAIAVELFNPNDPYYNGTDSSGRPRDVFKLWLRQFAVSVNGANPNVPADSNKWARLVDYLADPPDDDAPLSGRSFTKVVIHQGRDGGPNNHFDSIVAGFLPDEPSFIDTIDIDDPLAGQRFTLNLWRWDWRDNDGLASTPPVAFWFLVDEIDLGSSLPGETQWVSAYRDTTPTMYYGGLDADGDGLVDDVNLDGYADYARWNVVGRTSRSSAPPGGGPATNTIGNPQWLVSTGVPGPGQPINPDLDLLTFPYRFSPTTPLITMNAGPSVGTAPLHARLNDLPMFDNPYDLRPRSFPTVGFMLFVPRFSHVQMLNGSGGDNDDALIPVSEVLTVQWDRRGYQATGAAGQLTSADYPADFGHMPVFDNTQKVPSGSYFHKDTGVGRVPWGMLVFDYFTTIEPTQDMNGDGELDIDPLRIPGRLNINATPWQVLANLPMLGPDRTDFNGEIPVRIQDTGTVPTAAEPSPSFWDPGVGVLVGWDTAGIPRLLAFHTDYLTDSEFFETSVPYAPQEQDLPLGRYRLGPWLAQSAAAYRDGVQYLRYSLTDEFNAYAGGFLRDGAGQYEASGGTLVTDVTPYRMANTITGGKLYGRIRGSLNAGEDPDLTEPDRPKQFGFVTIGELMNVKGFDSSRHDELPPNADEVDGDPRTPELTTLYKGDFVKAVSIVALLDSQYLTTRSNTFTAYTSVMDRQDPKASVRSQVTVDRSNLLPRLTYAYCFVDRDTGRVGPCDSSYPLNPQFADYAVAPLLLDLKDALGNPGTDLCAETPVRTTNEGATPRIITREHVGYFNARYDD